MPLRVIRPPRAKYRKRPRLRGNHGDLRLDSDASLRSIVDMDVLGERSVILDCDVLQADGGTRTAAITGAYVGEAAAWRCGQLGEIRDFEKISPSAIASPRQPASASSAAKRCSTSVIRKTLARRSI